MPGIFGFVSTQGLPDARGLARTMGALLSSHDDQRSSAVCGDRWALGATWIPGLQLAPEPAATADGAYRVAHGEVYPVGDEPAAPPAPPGRAIHDALAARDPARLARVNGQFAGAVFHPGSGELELACDRYGLCSLYWTARDGLFAFASEAKALLAVPGVGRELDPEGLATFLLIGEHFSDTTLLAGVKMAPAASVLRSMGGPPSIETWWRIRFTSTVRRAQEREAVREVGRRFRRAVERQTEATPAIGVPLSGGLDSRLCLAAIPEARRGGVAALTFGEPGCFDRRFAREVARRCGVRHVEHDYRHAAIVEGAARGAWITDGVAGATDFNILPFVDDLADLAGVALNGFAGDVVLGGNFHWRRVRGLPHDRLAAAAFAKRNDCLSPREAASSLRGPAREAARDVPAAFGAALEAHRQEEPLGTLDAFLLDSRIRRWTSFGTQLLRARVLSRAPFYDNDLFDSVLAIPPGWRTDHGLYRKVLVESFPEVAGVGWETTGFPASWPPGIFRVAGAVARRGLAKVEGLTGGAVRSPYPANRMAAALRGPLATRIKADLFDGPGLHWEVFDRAAGERVFAELQAGADGRAKLVGVLLSLRHFLAQCQGGRPAPPLPAERVLVTAVPDPGEAAAVG